MTSYNLDAKYIFYSEAPSTFYCKLGAKYTFTLPAQGCASLNEEAFVFAQTGVSKNGETIHANGTLTCNPPDGSLLNFTQSFSVAGASAPSAELTSSYVNIVVKKCSEVDNCTDCDVDKAGTVV